jgi:hypothetical protein
MDDRYRSFIGSFIARLSAGFGPCAWRIPGFVFFPLICRNEASLFAQPQILSKT